MFLKRKLRCVRKLLLTFWKLVRRLFYSSKVQILVTLAFILCYFVTKLKVSRIDSDNFLQVSKCPACYGTDFCAIIQSGNLTAIPKITLERRSLWSAIFNVKNVYFGTWGAQKIVLKKLAHSWEFETFDNAIEDVYNETPIPAIHKTKHKECMLEKILENAFDLNISPIVLIRRVLRLLDHKMAAFGLHSDVNACDSRQFLKIAFDIYKNNEGKATLSTLSHFVTTLLLNAEPVIIKLVAGSSLAKRFPKYLGACGRVIIENYVGKTLDHFSSLPWIQRLNISLDLLHFAQQMTSNSLKLNFYWTDVSYENFAVSDTGHTVLVDVEGIILVDPDSTENDTSIYRNPYGALQEFGFSVDDLCHHRLSDHNVFAVCKCLLSSHPCSGGIPGGLLWGIPKNVSELWPIVSLLEECENGKNRFDAAEKLITTMEAIIRQSERHNLNFK